MKSRPHRGQPQFFNRLLGPRLYPARVRQPIAEDLAWRGEGSAHASFRCFTSAAWDVLTGDFPANWVNNLRPDLPVVATEFVSTSISSEGDGARFPRHWQEALAENPYVRILNRERGCIRCRVMPREWRSDRSKRGQATWSMSEPRCYKILAADHGSRCLRLSIALASASSPKDSSAGFQRNFLPNRIAMLPMWATVAVRWPISAGA